MGIKSFLKEKREKRMQKKMQKHQDLSERARAAESERALDDRIKAQKTRINSAKGMGGGSEKMKKFGMGVAGFMDKMTTPTKTTGKKPKKKALYIGNRRVD